MLTNMRMLDREEETDDGDTVTWEDQQRISTFSKLNGRIKTIDGQLDGLKQEKEALDDLSMEMELADEDEPVLYKIGEAFLQLRHAQALKRLEKDQTYVDSQIAGLAANAEDCATQMSELKATLYAKFGKAINLDD